MGLNKLWERCSAPKETNRQIWPLLKRWVNSRALGIQPVKANEFQKDDKNAILDATDASMKKWAMENLNYTRNKGLDFIGRFNKRYIIGEAKFLTDFGGHQNAQFDDAMSTIANASPRAITVAILDGVLYINGRKNKMYHNATKMHCDQNILSALLLREFLYSV
jgi:hypothetical protein